MSLLKFPVPPSLTFLANEMSRGITVTKIWRKTSPMRAVSNTSPRPASRLADVLSLHLHRGEAETIALAADVDAEIVIVDEQEGRKVAVAMGLQVTGVLGILLRAKRLGEIRALKPEIESLRNRARFFIAPSLEAKLVAAAGE